MGKKAKYYTDCYRHGGWIAWIDLLSGESLDEAKKIMKLEENILRQ